MFRLILLRALLVGTQRMVAGAELQADPQTARELIAAGRARLADPAELDRLVAAVQSGASEPAAR